ncbi:MAG: DUF1028 domain-containing protein [Bacillota bacterium]
MDKDNIVATFSITGFDPETGELGIAVQSKFLAVGSVVPWAEAEVGAIATQSLANVSYGPEGLKLLKEGKTPEEVIEILIENDDESELRQVGIVDAEGNSATFTGEGCYEWAGGITGDNFAAQGNILVDKETVKAMADTFQSAEGTLAERLVAGLIAGQKQGGDKRGRQSAALYVVKEEGGYGGYNDHYIDLRVDDHPTPIKELKRLLDIFYLYFGDKEVESVKIEGELIKEIKENLSVLGHYSGKINQEWDSNIKKSLQDYYQTENFEERDHEEGYIDKDILDYMRNRVKQEQKE